MTDSRGALRRTTEEIFTLYKLNPQFRDVIVEGRTDARWIRWFVNQLGIDAKVYAVDDRIHIDRATTLSFHRENNARGRVIAFAELLAKNGDISLCASAIIDSDFDVIDRMRGEDVPNPSPLLRTDYPSIEVYAMDARPLSKFLTTVIDTDESVETIYDDIVPVLQILFAVRFVIHRMGFTAKIPKKVAEDMQILPDRVYLNHEDLLKRCTPSLTRDDLARAAHETSALLADFADGRGLSFAHGHDIAPVFAKYFRLANHMARPEVLELHLMQSLELSDLHATPMFQRLSERLAD
ncbi:hypothetical protein AB4Z55_02830 [Gordonia sp. ABKF26]|uniref:hypothetical protein n=1 Tax=Gordonia sp. ABKF26 TaxID=3238687 RepID=UPI0034E5D889